MLGIVALHAGEPRGRQLEKQRSQRVAGNAQGEGMRQHGHPARLADHGHGRRRGQARPVHVGRLAVAQPLVEDLVLVLGVALLDHHLAEMRPADHVLARHRLHLVPGHGEAQRVEFFEHALVAHLAAVADPLHLPDQLRIRGVHPVAEHVHDAGGAVHAQLHARHRPHRCPGRRRQEAREAGNRVVVRQRQRRQPDLRGLRRQLLGREGSVGKRRMAMQVDHGLSSGHGPASKWKAPAGNRPARNPRPTSSRNRATTPRACRRNPGRRRRRPPGPRDPRRGAAPRACCRRP